jgi:hypothetical protein
MIDVTDGFLQVTLSPQNTAPIFATVYQDYILRYGVTLSVDDQFFVECASLFTEGMQVGRFALRPRISTISFQNPEDKEKLAFIKPMVEYYKRPLARKFLVYGQLLRPLVFTEPAPMPMLAHKSTGKKSPGQFPALTSGVFHGDDGDVGVFLTNASRKDLRFAADLDLAAYGFAEAQPVQVHKIDFNGDSRVVSQKATGVLTLVDSLPARSIAMFRIQPRNPS